MAHRTTVLLPDDLHAAWKATGRPLADLIRRGLAPAPGPAAADLTSILGRLDALEARQHASPSQLDDLAAWLNDIHGQLRHLGARIDGQLLGLGAAVDDLSDRIDEELAGDWEAEQAERHHRNAATWHATLWAAHGSTPVDVFDAAAVWDVTKNGARDRLGHIIARGLATLAPRGPGQPRDLYTMHAPEQEPSE